ncbi:MAG: substrate-binding domain-containing protein [Coriobacteriia bacterium]|nr:substrate-binding domain-containing protein [Coriobacteriia bacterium]
MMRSTRIRIAAMVATVAMVASFATPALATTTLHISGSTTLFPLASKWASVFKASNGWGITVVGGGSGKGISDVKGGAVDIGMSSRMKQASDGSSVVFTPVARDALVIVINPKLLKKYPKYIYRLSATQVQRIFRGQITKWSQINGHLPKHAIDLVGRTGSSGTYTYFKQMFLTSGTSIGEIGSTQYKQSARTRTYASNGSVRSSVAGDMYAIGYLSDAYVNSSVHALNMPAPANYYDSDYVEHATPASLAGKWIVPSTKTALNGTYLYVRPLYYVTVGAPAGNAATFINWCLGAGQAYCSGQHYLPLH